MRYADIVVGIVIASVLPVGCQPNRQGKSASDTSQPLEIPKTALPSVNRAQRLGQVVFEHDSVGSRATDAIYRRVHTLDPKVRGWLTLKNGESWTVPFLTNENGAMNVLYRVKFGSFLDTTPQVEVLDTPEPVDEITAKMFAARETATRQAFQKCSTNYNTVVIPATELGRDGWLVYLLAATTEAGVVVSGGHHRFLVSGDGSTVVDHFQFTKACLTIPAPKVAKGERVAGRFITHLTSDTPTEVHVFLSLLHHIPFYVGVAEPRALWEVNGSRVELIATKE